LFKESPGLFLSAQLSYQNLDLNTDTPDFRKPKIWAWLSYQDTDMDPDMNPPDFWNAKIQIWQGYIK
jgi:hypothetical protein